VAVREKAHYVFDFLISRVTGRAKRISTLVRDVFNVATPLVLGFFSAQVAVKIHFWIMPAMEVSRSLVYAACPVGCLFMVFYSVRHLIENLRHPVESS
jgi:TRAP-type C4-dicarboxylate transport system permease small subunit